jgi:dihydroxyacid dehydratase/phosphogluconate dehydratase
MVYGGSIMPGYSETLKKPINISTCYEKHGAYIYKNLQSAEVGKFTPDEIMDDIERNACPGAGACGGMYTANTMSTSIEGRFVNENMRQAMLTSVSNGSYFAKLIYNTRNISC